MPIKYSDISFAIPRPDAIGQSFMAPASSVSISHQGQLEESRLLAANQNNNFRISGPAVTKIAVNFPLCNKFLGNDTGSTSYNLLSGLLTYLTGATGTTINIGPNSFLACYLDKVSVTISPFAAIMCSADFTCTNSSLIENNPFASSGSSNNGESLSNYLGYGNNVSISGGSAFSEGNQNEISYTLSMNRTYQTSIGSAYPTNIFLDSIMKEMTIKDTNIYRFINYSGGTGDIMTVIPKTASGVAMLPSGAMSFSQASRVMNQNISISAGSIAAADISIKEMVL